MHAFPERLKARGNSFHHLRWSPSLIEGGYADGAVMCAGRSWRPQASAVMTAVRGRALSAVRRYQIVDKADTSIVNCQLSIRPSTVHCQLPTVN